MQPLAFLIIGCCGIVGVSVFSIFYFKVASAERARRLRASLLQYRDDHDDSIELPADASPGTVESTMKEPLLANTGAETDRSTFKDLARVQLPTEDTDVSASKSSCWVWCQQCLVSILFSLNLTYVCDV